MPAHVLPWPPLLPLNLLHPHYRSPPPLAPSLPRLQCNVQPKVVIICGKAGLPVTPQQAVVQARAAASASAEVGGGVGAVVVRCAVVRGW